MAVDKRFVNRRYYNEESYMDGDSEGTYVYGNTVRKTAVPQWSPVEEPQLLPPEPPRKTGRKHRKSRQERALELAKVQSLPSLAVMAVCLVAAGLSIFNYVGAKNDLDIHARTVKNLQTELQNDRLVNEAKLKEIEAGINYTEIYDYAINSLGMTFPGKDQVLWYNSTESEYVSQYEVIPQK